MTEEEYVRSVWKNVIVCDGSYRHYAKGTILLNWANHCFYEFSDFTFAYDFTKQREREIAEVEEEMRLLQSMVILLSFERGDLTTPVYQRTIARLEAIKADLTRGMRKVTSRGSEG